MSMCAILWQNFRNYIQYFLHLVLYSLCAIFATVFVLRVLLSSFVYLLYLMFICCERMCICCTLMCICFISCFLYFLCVFFVQKSIGLKFSKSRTGSDVRYSCHHNSNPPFTVRNNPLPAPAGCQFGCKVTYPSRLHITRLSVSPDPSCLRQAAIALQSVAVPSYAHVFPCLAARSPEKCASHISFAVY